MLCVWVHGCDPGRLSDGSRLALYQTLSIEGPSPIFFSGLWFVFKGKSAIFFVVFFLFLLFLFCFQALVGAL